ncbi:hypothetical protein LCGC14_3001930, partial [marine sediment metagenome]
SVVKGHRGEEEQHAAFIAVPQRSKLRWPDGNHNKSPSGAVDVGPYIKGIGVPWASVLMLKGYSKREARAGCIAHFCQFSGVVLSFAESMGIKLRWGGNWDGDDIILIDQRFDDLPHYELRP